MKYKNKFYFCRDESTTFALPFCSSALLLFCSTKKNEKKKINMQRYIKNNLSLQANE